VPDFRRFSLVQLFTILVIIASLLTIFDWITPHSEEAARPDPVVKQFIERQRYWNSPEYRVQELEERIECQEERYQQAQERSNWVGESDTLWFHNLFPDVC
jgi:hypothetical protein